MPTALSLVERWIGLTLLAVYTALLVSFKESKSPCCAKV